MSKKINNQAVDFQPDAVEIAMRPLPTAARLGVLFGIVVFTAAVIASIFCKVDVIVEASGKLVSEEKNIVMKPLDRAVIKSIHVKPGDRVRKDQLLISFDPTINHAEEERLRSEKSNLEAQYERWKAEFEEKEYTIPARPSAHQMVQLKIFQDRLKYYQSKLQEYDSSLRSLDAKIKTTKTSIEEKNEQAKILKENVDRHEGLLKKGSSTKERLNSALNEYLEVRGEIATLETGLHEYAPQKASINAQKNTYISEWRKDIAEKFLAAEQALITINKSLEKVLRLNEYVELRAPCDAIVHEIAPFPIGSAVREAEALVTLVPSNDIHLEAEIPAKDIGKVKTGDKVRIKLNAFPFQKHGTIEGTIVNISEDTFQKDNIKQENEKIATGTYYRTKIRLPREIKLRNLPPNFRLIPGMECQAEIKVGTRKVIEYIIHPLVKSLDEAAREPD